MLRPILAGTKRVTAAPAGIMALHSYNDGRKHLGSIRRQPPHHYHTVYNACRAEREGELLQFVYRSRGVVCYDIALVCVWGWKGFVGVEREELCVCV